MLDSAHLFEIYRDDAITAKNVLKEIQNKFPPHVLFSEDTLNNKALFSKLREHLTGMDLEPDSSDEVTHSTRVQIKVADIIYPGDKFKNERADAINRFNVFLQTGSTKDIPNPPQPGPNATPKDPDPNDPTSELTVIKNSINNLQHRIDEQQETFKRQMAQLSDILEKLHKNSTLTTKTTVKAKRINNESDNEENTQNNSRIHHYISHRFKDKENKFGGKDDEDLFEHFLSYETVSEDYKLTDEQNNKYVHNLFKEEALRFYNQYVKQSSISYRDTKAMMLRHFNSADVQNLIKNELMTLNFNTFIEKEKYKTKALSSMASYISNRSPKCPISYRHESHRVEFLKRALIKEKWASTILMQINEETIFQSLYTRLANALQFHIESTENVDHDPEQHTTPRKHGSKPTIYYTQPKYAKRMVGKLFTGSSYDKNCCNCGKRGHNHYK